MCSVILISLQVSEVTEAYKPQLVMLNSKCLQQHLQRASAVIWCRLALLITFVSHIQESRQSE